MRQFGRSICFAKRPFHGESQRRNVFLDDAPHGIEVDIAVVVHEYIPHAGDLSPRDLGVAVLEIVREPFRGLTNDLYLTMIES